MFLNCNNYYFFMFPVVEPNPFWVKKTSYPKLSKNIKTEVVIVGAGIAGITSAIHLQEHGYKVTLVEQSKVCYGATGSSSGILYFGTGTDCHSAIELFGEKNARLLWEETKKSIEIIHSLIEKNNIHCGLRKPGTIIIARDEKENELIEREAIAMKRLGYPGKMLNSTDIKGIFSGKEFFSGLEQDFCSQIKPGLFAGELCEKFNLQVFENTPMRQIEETRNGLIVKSPEARIDCDGVVVASNIQPFFGLEKNFVVESSTIIPSIELGPRLKELWKQDKIFWTPDEYYDIFYQHDGRAFFEVYRLKGAQEKISRYFPGDVAFEMNKQWGSVWSKTRDWLPIVGKVKEKVFSAIAVGDQGIVIGFTAGRKIVAAIEGKNDPLLEMFSPKRFPIKA